MQEQGLIVIQDNDGTALGSVLRIDGKMVLVDVKGRKVGEMDEKATVRNCRDILLEQKLNYMA